MNPPGSAVAKLLPPIAPTAIHGCIGSTCQAKKPTVSFKAGGQLPGGAVVTRAADPEATREAEAGEGEIALLRSTVGATRRV
jgi:hypothetical protein